MRVFFNLLFRLIALLPLRYAHTLGSSIGSILSMVPHPYQFAVNKNLALCFPDLGKSEIKTLKKKCYQELGKTAFEVAAMWTWPQAKVLELIKDVTGLDELEKGLTAGKGTILALPHLGCWEIIGLYISSHYPMTSLYRPPRIPSLDSIMSTARQRFGATLVPTNSGGIRALYGALKKNQVTAILPDQDPRQEGNVFSPFFGVTANTPTLLSRLAHKSGAKVLFAYAERLPKGQGFHLHIRTANPAVSDKNVNTAVNALNKGVEECVREIPEQYQWTYKRFKTRPAGENKFY